MNSYLKSLNRSVPWPTYVDAYLLWHKQLMDFDSQFDGNLTWIFMSKALFGFIFHPFMAEAILVP